MSIQPQPITPVPEETQRVACAAFPKGNAYMTMQDELGVFFQDEDFKELFHTRGQPGYSPWRLALVTVMQFAENLTDRQAAEAVRSRIDWKYALGLELTDAGFHYSVLSEFRARLIEGQVEHLLLDAMLERFQELGLLKPRMRQRSDSTHVIAAVQNFSRTEMVTETLRQALNTLATLIPEWLQSQVPAEWFERYGKPFSEHGFSKKPENLDEFAVVVGRDGVWLMTHIYNSSDLSWIRHVPDVEILRQVWVQQYYIEDDKVYWREKDDRPPSTKVIASPYDPDARFSRKRNEKWLGYKVHFTETCEPDYPHLLVHTETTVATLQDVKVVDKIHDELEQRNLLPSQHFVDTGYMSSHVLVTSQALGVDLVGPVRTDRSPQHQAGEGFDLPHFQIDWDAQAMTCPQGHQSIQWREQLGKRGLSCIRVAFDKKDCLPCPVRSKCTHTPSDRPRVLTILCQDEYLALQNARQRMETEEFKENYKRRAGIEGTISEGVQVHHLRQARYRGHQKTALENILIAAGMNLKRCTAWLRGYEHSQTRVTRFAALAPAV